MSTFHGIWTGALIVLFLILIAWAWSDARKTDFDDASRLPLEDDEIEDGAER